MDHRTHLRNGRIMAAFGVAALIGGFLGSVNVAEAEVEIVVELVPDHPGPYSGGQILTVDVWLHSQASWDLSLSHLQLDFSITDTALGLDPLFTFDYSSIVDAAGYTQRHPELPVPWTYNGIKCFCPEAFLPLPAGGSLHIGSIGVRMPLAPGTYSLDVMNPDETEWAGGAMFNCQSCSPWRASTGEIAGGTLDFDVGELAVPTVSQWGLIALSTLLVAAGGVIIRRREARQNYCAHS